MSLSCLYYDHNLRKLIPCFLIPNKIFTIQDGRKYVNVTYDSSQFETYNTNYNELYRYSSSSVRLIDLYPNTNSEQLAYAQACVPNLIANQSTYQTDELNRVVSLVTMISSVTPSQDTFYKLCDFISCEILFTVLQDSDRKFMAVVGNMSLNTSNIGPILTQFGGIVPVKMYLLMIYNLFNLYSDNTVVYYLQNSLNLSDVISRYNIVFPISLNIQILRPNMIFLYSNGYIT